MIEETSGSTYDNIDSLYEFFRFGFAIGPTHDEAVGLTVFTVCTEFLADAIGLYGQFLRWGSYNGASAVALQKFRFVEGIERWDEER